jgi:hypothetical protein
MPQFVFLDLTGLALAWAAGTEPEGAVMLRSQVGVVNFASRENPDPAVRANLVVKWSAGRTDRLTPSADAYFPCPSTGSSGAEPIFKVDLGWNAMLVFPFAHRAKATVVSATLILSSAQQYGRDAQVSVYAIHLPQAPAAMFSMGAGLSGDTFRDAGLEDKPGVLYVQRFSGLGWLTFMSDLRTFDNLRTVGSGDANGFRALDGNALAVTLLRGKHLALNHQIYFRSLPGGEPEEAYFRYYLRLGDDWNPEHEGGKMPGFAGTYGRAGWGPRATNGLNGWSARGNFFAVDPDSAKVSQLRGLGSYVYTATTTQVDGEVWGWNLGPTGLVPKNRWVSIEQRVKLNTPGQDNGVLQVWVDGQPAFSRTDIRWGDTAALKIESVWMNVFYGGTGVPTHDMTLYIDNLVIARHYIGPGNFPR